MPTLQDGTELTGPRALEVLRRYAKRYDELAASVEHAEHLAGQAAGAQIAHHGKLAELKAAQQAASARTEEVEQRLADAETRHTGRMEFMTAEEARKAAKLETVTAALAVKEQALATATAGLAAVVKQAQGIGSAS